MDNVTNKLEEKLAQAIDNFDKSPIKTAIKWVIVIYILKKVIDWIKE